MSGPTIPTETLTPEQEREWEIQVRHRNRVTAILLGIFVAMVAVATVVMIIRTGFQPLDNLDLFRSN